MPTHEQVAAQADREREANMIAASRAEAEWARARAEERRAVALERLVALLAPAAPGEDAT